MQGMITTKNNTYIFRKDHAHEPGFWAWRIYDPAPGDRVKTHKWKELPKGKIVLFNLDAPPRTLPFIPLLA